MVLRLKTRESRSLPGLQNATLIINLLIHANGPKPSKRAAHKAAFRVIMVPGKHETNCKQFARAVSVKRQRRFTQPRQIPTGFALDAGWSSPVARQAHNLKAAGSNPAPATRSFLPKSIRSSWSSPLGGQSIHWIDCLSASPRQAHILKLKGRLGAAR